MVKIKYKTHRVKKWRGLCDTLSGSLLNLKSGIGFE
jgi:hypothetical protein